MSEGEVDSKEEMARNWGGYQVNEMRVNKGLRKLLKAGGEGGGGGHDEGVRESRAARDDRVTQEEYIFFLFGRGITRVMWERCRSAWGGCEKSEGKEMKTKSEGKEVQMGRVSWPREI